MSDAPTVTLVCLPFAGAGASFYRPWAAHPPAGLAILPLQLPGRERRIDVPPHRDGQAAADELVADLLAALPGPASVALFGHSLGAVLAYEVAQRLTGHPRLGLRHLFVSGSPDPDTPRSRRASGLPGEEFLARVREFAGYDHEALADPEMRELILPTLQADVAMHEDYRPSTLAPLPVPVTAVRGAQDTLTDAQQAGAWSKVAGRDFAYRELPGGHMYLAEDPAALLDLIAARLRPVA